MSHEFWGILMILIGLFLFISGLRKSEFIVYKLLVARSRILWGEKVHQFHQIAGILVIIAGILFATGLLTK